MLRIFDKLSSRSIRAHRNDLMLLADWVEAGLLLHEPTISRSNVVDLFIEQHLYEDQDFCNERIEDVWAELQRRSECVPHTPIKVGTGGAAEAVQDWRKSSAYTFCLVLSLLPQYKDVNGDQTAREAFGADYSEQGELFELVTQAALRSQWPDWSVEVTGWSSNEPAKLREVVTDVCAHLGEDTGNIDKWAEEYANEAGLDLVMWRNFRDHRAGPRYFLQAGSGTNWQTKIKTPDLEIWGKFVDFTVKPVRALAIPFALDSREFARRSVRVEGLFLDRCRLLAVDVPEHAWLPEEVRARLVAWLEPRVEWLAEGAIPLVDA